MCGIIGYVGSEPVTDILIQGLRRLEYRGYDSAGIALIYKKKINIWKSQGRLENVESLLKTQDPELHNHSTLGIGHTRWATHGRPTTENAHPHKTGHVVLVHNGIIENYLEIKRGLLARGHKPLSETDSELLAFMILEEMDQGLSLLNAVRKSFTQIHGQCSILVMSEKEPDTIVAVRNGSPLVVGSDAKQGSYFASDAQALLAYTQNVIFLEQGDLVVGQPSGVKFYDLLTGKSVERQLTRLDWSIDRLGKNGFDHYMLKEIYEQPATLVDTLNGLMDRSSGDPFCFVNQPAIEILNKAEELHLVACGTSWHAALLGKYWIERWANIPVSVEIASEFRYREPVLRPGVVVVGITQSGETADTLAVFREMRRRKIPTVGISNVRGSTISREADAVLYSSAGPEIGVAATKSFSAQLMVMYLLAGHLAWQRKSRSLDEIVQSFSDLIKIPHILADELETGSSVVEQTRKIARSLADAKGFFFIGRGYSFPIALEGALKLKEIAYDHSEGYAAGELKHGPIAMIDQGMVVVVLAPRDSWRDKTVSNLEEVKARGATIVGVGDCKDEDLKGLCNHWIPLPEENRSVGTDLLPFLLNPVVQLLSYHRAVFKGTDVDRPRNLAKSVTVE